MGMNNAASWEQDAPTVPLTRIIILGITEKPGYDNNLTSDF